MVKKYMNTGKPMDDEAQAIRIRSEIRDMRKDLEAFTEADFLSIESDMWKKGYRNMDRLDKIMWSYLGEEKYKQSMEQMVEYTCLDADYLEVPHHGNAFQQMLRINKARGYDGFMEALAFCFLTDQELELKPLTQQQMKQHIIRRYNGGCRRDE